MKGKFTSCLALLFALGGATAAAQQAGALDRSKWKVSVSSECQDGSCGWGKYLIDGDPNTYWHSNWRGNAGHGTGGSLPECIIIDLGSEQTFEAIGYMSRGAEKTAKNGDCLGYKIYVSKDSFNLGSFPTKDKINGLTGTATEGTISYTGTGQVEKLITPQTGTSWTGRYVAFVFTQSRGQSEGEKNKFANCAELNIYASLTGMAREDLQAAISAAQAWDSTAVGYKNLKQAIEAAQKVYDDKGASKDSIEKAIETLNQAVSTTAVIQPEPGEPYRLVSAYQAFKDQQGVEKGVYTDGTQLLWTSVSKADPSQVWTFATASGNGKFTVANKADSVFFASANGSSSSVSKTGAAVTLVSTAPGQWTLTIAGSNAPIHSAGHNSGAGKNGTIVAFGQKDAIGNGSAWKIVAVSDADLPDAKKDLQAAIESKKTAIDNNQAPHLVGSYKSTDKGLVDAINTEGITTLDSVYAAYERLQAIKPLQVQAGQYYRLCNTATKAYLSVDGTNARGTVSADSLKRVDLLWQFVSTANGYKIKSVHLGKYLANVVAGSAKTTSISQDSAQAPSYTINFPNAATHAQLTSPEGGFHSINCEGANNNYNINAWNAENSYWLIMEAPTLEVSLSEAADATWSTVSLPFSVGIPEGVEAYTGTINEEGNALTLNKQTAIPAGEGFILKGTQGTTTAALTIGAEANAVTDNALTGTMTGIAFGDSAVRSQYLVLGIADNEVGFYRPASSIDSIPAYKAYIANSGTVQSLRLIDTVTGIAGAPTVGAEKDKAIYDLSGRRVTKPAKGIYLQGGKKIIVK